MADAPAYQSGLIAALRGGAPSQGVSVPGMTLTPNAPSPQGSPVLFGGAPMTGNLMTPPRFAQAPSASPLGAVQQPAPQPFAPQQSAPFVPQMSGNLMPVPQFEPAPDYVAPPPKPVDPNAPFINKFGYWEYPGESIDFGSSGND